MNSGINGYSRTQCNQLRINVQEREKGNKSNTTCYINSSRDDMTMSQFIRRVGPGARYTVAYNVIVSCPRTRIIRRSRVRSEVVLM